MNQSISSTYPMFISKPFRKKDRIAKMMTGLARCLLPGVAVMALSACALADAPDLSITGISLGMTLDQVKAALPADFKTEVLDQCSGFSGSTLEGIDVSSEIVTAYKLTDADPDSNPDSRSHWINDVDGYVIQLYHGKVIYIGHGQNYTQKTAPLAAKVVAAVKEKYGVVVTHDYGMPTDIVDVGYIYFNNDTPFLSSVSKDNAWDWRAYNRERAKFAGFSMQIERDQFNCIRIRDYVQCFISTIGGEGTKEYRKFYNG